MSADPDVPDLLKVEKEPTADGASTSGEAGSGTMTKDTKRLLIAVAILVFVAVAAIGIGLSRKSSSESASTTGSTTSTAALGTPATTSKAGGASAGAGGGGGGCQNGSWPKTYTAKPDAETLKKAGIHVWNDLGWKIRIVDPDSFGYAGEINASFSLDAKSVKAVGDAKVETKDNKVTFSSPGGSGKDVGIDFSLPCAVDQFTIGFLSSGIAVSADVITVGKDAHAVGNPLIITKLKA